MDNIQSFNDFRGKLTPIEFNILSFEPKRIFYVQNVPVNTIRGNHAHYNTKQYLVCLKGLIEVVLNDGKNETFIILSENQAVFVDNMIWDSQKFLEENSTLLVLCSTEYNPNDYIFDFEFFKKIKYL